jgi:hypothetical protein
MKLPSFQRRGVVVALLTLAAGGVLAGCESILPVVQGGELIVMDVANDSPRPATLVVAAPGTIEVVVGSVDPPVVPARQRATVRFFVPPTGSWAIWANGGELMGDRDVGGKRGNVPMGIDVGANGEPSWWCRADCP